MFIDVHTHNKEELNAVISIHAHDFLDLKYPTNQLFTTGVHPWFAESTDVDKFIQQVKQLKPNNLIGIGECGLDRAKGPDMALQKSVFETQITLARALKKPIIIHQVKTISDILPLMKHNSDLTFVFHGYNGNETQTRQLLEYDAYFSFGTLLEKPIDKVKKAIEAIPCEKLFLETDESGINIVKLYGLLAELKKVSEKELEAIVIKNFEKVFKKDIDDLD